MTYRGGAGRSIRGSQYGGNQQRGPRQGGGQNQGTGGNPARQIAPSLPRLDAQFLRDSKFTVSKPISDILEYFNAIMRVDIGPSGGAMLVIVPNPQLGNPNAQVPTISDLKKLNAIAAFINNAKRESVSSDTKNQAMADAFRIYMGIPSATRNTLSTSLTNNELTLIATTVSSVATLEENRKTILSNTSSEESLKTLLINDVIVIKNASFRYLVSLLCGESLKESSIKKRSADAGVSEFMYAKLTKKITVKASEDLVNFIFPRNDWIAGFYLTFSEVRDLEIRYVEKYSMLTRETAVLVGLLRNDELVRAVNFLSEDFSFSRESEILSRMNRQAVNFLPPYDLKKVADLISAKKTGVYEARWANLPNSLDPVSGTKALAHSFLRLKLLQVSMDVSYLFDDLFRKGEAFRTSLREKPIGEEFSVGNWIVSNICEDEDCNEDLYDHIFSDLESEDSVLYLERYLTSQLGFMESHRFTRVLRSFLTIEKTDDGKLQLSRTSVEETISVTGEDGKPTTQLLKRERINFPSDITIGPDYVDRPITAARDYCNELKIGQASVTAPDPTSDAGRFRKRHFAESLADKGKVQERRGLPEGSTAITHVSKDWLRDLYAKNKDIAVALNEFLRGFSNGEVQNYVVKVLHARESQLLGIDPMSDLLSINPDANADDDVDDTFFGLDES